MDTPCRADDGGKQSETVRGIVTAASKPAGLLEGGRKRGVVAVVVTLGADAPFF